MSEKQWQTVLAVAAAVVAFLLTQPDIVLSPAAKVALGAVSVALAVLSPTRLAYDVVVEPDPQDPAA